MMNLETTRIVQLKHVAHGRRLALVQEPCLVLLNTFKSVYELALHAIDTNQKLKDLITTSLCADKLDYDSIYNGNSDWQLLPAFDHPENSFACLVSGTGLTHKNSALNRQMMHQQADDKATDSMQMYQWGVEGGMSENGQPGVQPEWFYKGTGSALKAHGEILEVPVYGNDGGEEPEIAGIYIIGRDAVPRRIGFCTGNEFSDHVMEKKNYLYLAPSKLRDCAIGPELAIIDECDEFSGKVSIIRNGEERWSSPIKSGEKNMAHSIANLEYHHFKYAIHRIPLQAHVHFFGADAFSFGNKIALADGDLMNVYWEGLGRELKNTLKIAAGTEEMIVVKSI